MKTNKVKTKILHFLYKIMNNHKIILIKMAVINKLLTKKLIKFIKILTIIHQFNNNNCKKLKN